MQTAPKGRRLAVTCMIGKGLDVLYKIGLSKSANKMIKEQTFERFSTEFARIQVHVECRMSCS